MTQFAFLKADFPEVFANAERAERLVKGDARGASFYARLALETAVKWMYRHDGALGDPYQDALSAMIHHSSFRAVAGEALVAKARVIIKRGNIAAHDSRSISEADAVSAVRELFHFTYWLQRNYGRSIPDDGLQFSADALPHLAEVKASTLGQLTTLAKRYSEQTAQLKAAEVAQLKDAEARAALEAELADLRAQIASRKAENAAVPDRHDYNEAATRDALIDVLLREAGWTLDRPEDIEFQVDGMPKREPTSTGKGYIDYVLWGDDGKPLGLVEAKRTKRDPREGGHQAKLYADCLEARYGQRPVIFYSNGYDHWLWDDEAHPPREVQGFYKKDELSLLIQRRSRAKSPSTLDINAEIAGRSYQMRAIRRVCESFEVEGRRRALLVMATGTGKTRTTIALSDLLMRAHWARRILFLADRRALVKQAYNAFKKHLPSATIATSNAGHDPAGGNDLFNSRVVVATYPSMMKRIDVVEAGERPYGVGHFDLIVVDEAHRSIYKKFGAIFEYFDGYLLGLTATPKDEIDRDTYKTFDLENGVPTDAYPLEQAVDDGYLVPPIAYSVPLKFQRDGIRYDDLSDEEKDQWDALEWSEDGEIPDQVESAAVNKWLFNTDTVDKVLAHLMEHGVRVNEGDRLGKTIIFAKSNDHAYFIAERFDANYPHLKGKFAQVITYKTEHAQSLIDDFSEPEKEPHIAISVDMLDTGIDVPEIVNLVFFKLVRSKTKFWQMIGRGTRLCEDLFGPGRDKDHFAIFDFCQNFEFFNQNPDQREPKAPDTITKRIFIKRLELVAKLAPETGSRPSEGVAEDGEPFLSEKDEGRNSLKKQLTDLLHDEVAAMNLDNFIVRARRKIVEPFQSRERWSDLSHEDRHQLIEHVAGLPSAQQPEHITAKQFDSLVLSAQLALLSNDASFARLADRIRLIAGELAERTNIPTVAARIELIEDIQTDSFWEGVNILLLEDVRLKLRALVQLIEPKSRKPVYTDFEDEIGPAKETALSDSSVGTDLGRFRMKTRRFLDSHRDHIAVRKLYRNERLTPTDLDELEKIMRSNGVGDDATFEKVQSGFGGLGRFIRSLVGLDREAAKQAFSSLLNGAPMTSNQIDFIELIIDELSRSGLVAPERLYEPPFTDANPLGVGGIFSDPDAQQVVHILREIEARTLPARPEEATA
ncbi:MAG: DEAD/DEAH box helicase family protein [Oceanicaulis sp.]|nr:DEAD/DEAH box helicase family protein [Oceanicaulis sp.]